MRKKSLENWMTLRTLRAHDRWRYQLCTPLFLLYDLAFFDKTRLFAENKSVQNAYILSAALTEERPALALHELQQGELQQHTPSARTPASAPVRPDLPPPKKRTNPKPKHCIPGNLPC